MDPAAVAIPLAEAHEDRNGSELEVSPRHDSSLDADIELRPVTPKRQIGVLISSFVTICITIGFDQAYGVFQNYYISPTQTFLPKSTRNESALVAFVGTLGYGLTWAGSIVVNPTMARLGVRGTRWLGILGVFCMSLGFALASLSTQVRLLHLSK
jgi:drug/metabolite transporter (DMT)-like permease